MKEPGKATDKAKDLVRMAVARASLLKPLMEKTRPSTSGPWSSAAASPASMRPSI